MKDSGIGVRIAQARRLLGVVLHQDMPQRAVAEMIGKSGATWSRWESEEDPPSEANLQAFVDLCARHGLEGVTLAWLRYGVGSGPPKIGAVPPRPLREPKPAERLERSIHKPGSKRTVNDRKRRR